MLDNWRIRPKDKRIVVYCKIMSGIPTVVKRKIISPFVTEVGVKGRLFPFDVSKPAYRIRHKFYYFVDIDNGQYDLGNAEQLINSKLLDSILVKQIGKQMITALENKPLMTEIVMILLACGMGIAVGFILGNVISIGD